MRDAIVLGEAVVLDARAASFATRMLSGAIDVVATILVVVLPLSLLLDLVSTRVVLDDYVGPILIGATVLVTVVVPCLVETATRGRSLGRWATGVRIVRDDGGPVRFRQTFIRALVGVGEIWMTFGSVALITSMLHPRGKRVGDVLAGTYAVRIRGGSTRLTPVVMPPWLEDWAVGADMRRLPDGVALSARQFLGRADRLNATSRARIGQSLAASIERFVAPGPPAGTHPEQFVAAVLAERRRREHAREQHAQGLAVAQTAPLRRLPHAVPDPDL